MLDLLRRYLRLGVGEEEPPPDDETPPEEAGTGDDTLDDLLDTVEPPKDAPKKGDEDDNAIVKEARRRAEAAERALADERMARQRDVAPAPRGLDPETERENAELARAKAEGKDTSWLEWQINSNRTIRETRRESAQALSRAEEIADRTAFEKLEITKPQVYKRYAERVEQTVAEAIRRDGRAPPRLAVLRLLIGDDIMNGKVKPKAAKAAATPAAQVPRGRTPNLRSDTTGKGGGQTEHDKRRARLENVIL